MSDKPDPELASELRQTAGREMAEEAAEDERLTELARRRRLKMSNVMEEIAHQGGRVTVQYAEDTFGGAVVAAGDDFAVIEGSGQIAEIRFDVGTWSVLPPGEPPKAQVGETTTFRALLAGYAAAHTTVRLALPDHEAVVGKITVVAEDHLEVNDVDDRLIYVPIDLILAIIHSTDVH